MSSMYRITYVSQSDTLTHIKDIEAVDKDEALWTFSTQVNPFDVNVKNIEEIV